MGRSVTLLGMTDESSPAPVEGRPSWEPGSSLVLVIRWPFESIPNSESLEALCGQLRHGLDPKPDWMGVTVAEGADIVLAPFFDGAMKVAEGTEGEDAVSSD